MLCLVFQAAGSHYALEASQARAIVPCAALRPCPGAPPWIAGLLNYHGCPAPVIDFSRLLGAAAGAIRLSTRIILLACPPPAPPSRLVGLLAERVESLRLAPESAQPAGVAAAPYLDGLVCRGLGMVQMVKTEKLLVPEYLPELFGA